MTKERGQASFNSREMTYFMDGSESITKVNNINDHYYFVLMINQLLFADEGGYDAWIWKRPYI